MRRRLRCI